MGDIIQVICNGIIEGSVYAMLALSFSLIYRVTGVVNLAQGAFCVAAALLANTLQTSLHFPALLAAIVSVLAIALLGAVTGWAVMLRALRRLSHTNILMVSAGLLTLVEGVTVMFWGSQPYTLPAFSGEQPITFAGLRIPTQGIWIMATSAISIGAIHLLLARTTIGQQLRACAQNPLAARLMGFNVPALSVASFGLAAFIAALGGIVVAPIMSVQFDTGLHFSVMAFIAMTIGGLGSFAGAVAGGLLLGLIDQLGASYVSSLFSNVATIAALFAVLLLRPGGLMPVNVARRTDVRHDLFLVNHVVRIRERTGWRLGAVAVALLLLLPRLLPESQSSVLGSLVIAGIFFIAVMGMDVLMGFAGQVNLGQAGFVAIGGYTAGYLSTHFDVTPLLGMLAGVVVSLVCAGLLAIVTMRLRGLFLALATLVFGLLIDFLAVGLPDITGGPSGMVGIPSFAIGDYAFDTPESMYYVVAGAAILIVLVLTGLVRSPFGRALQAIRTDQMAAAAIGINVPLYKAGAFAICAALGSVAGSLYAFNLHYLAPDMMGLAMSLGMVAMLVVGGEGTVVGGLVGAVILTVLPTIFQPLAQYKILASGAILVLTFLYLPAGIYGSVVLAFKHRIGADKVPAKKDATALRKQTP